MSGVRLRTCTFVHIAHASRLIWMGVAWDVVLLCGCQAMGVFGCAYVWMSVRLEIPAFFGLS
jgi:hypothetical protein